MDLFCSETINKQEQDIQRNNRYKNWRNVHTMNNLSGSVNRSTTYFELTENFVLLI